MADKKKEEPIDKYAEERYFVKCRKCGKTQVDKVNGHICVRCGGPCDKV